MTLLAEPQHDVAEETSEDDNIFHFVCTVCHLSETGDPAPGLQYVVTVCGKEYSVEEYANNHIPSDVECSACVARIESLAPFPCGHTAADVAGWLDRYNKRHGF